MGNRRGKHRTTPRSKQRYRGAAESTSYAQRNRLVKEMGFESYKHYLQSPLWFSIRSAVFQRDRGQCRACPNPARCVHHNKYTKATLAGKDLAPLFSLCVDCHNAIELGHGNKNGDKTIAAVREKLAALMAGQDGEAA